jgi:hypothetical protein
MLGITIHTNKKHKKAKTMKQGKKKQDDRLLKQLSHTERRQQELLRSMIIKDPLFKVA